MSDLTPEREADIRRWYEHRDNDTMGDVAIRDLLAELDRLRGGAERLAGALREIEVLPVDWTSGVDENCERLKDIARAALRQREERVKYDRREETKSWPQQSTNA